MKFTKAKFSSKYFYSSLEYLPYFIIVIIAITSCQNEKKKYTQNQTTVEIKTSEPYKTEKIDNSAREEKQKDEKSKQDSIFQLHYGHCTKWFEDRNYLESIKTKYFIDSIYIKSMKNDNLPLANKQILTKIKNGLSNNNLSSIFHPVYKLRDGMTSIISYDATENLILKDNLKKEDFQFSNNKITKFSNSITATNTTYGNHEHIYFYKALDTLKKIKNLENSIDIYGISSYTSGAVNNVGFMSGDCLEFIDYRFNERDIVKNLNPVFASSEKFIVEYENSPKMDSLHKKVFERTCYDCTFKYEKRTSFAKFEGIDNLYFCYADSFPVNKFYDYPSRSLTMIVGDTTIVDLWFENIDLFGCSCL